MKTVNIHEAKTKLSSLISEAERGEDVVIARDGTPVVRLVRVEQTPLRRRGEWNEQPGWENVKFDPAMFAPMTDAELKEEGWE